MKSKFKILISLFIFLSQVTGLFAQVKRDEDFNKKLELWRSLPESAKEQIKENYKKWEQLPKEKQDRLTESYKRYQSLNPEKKLRVQKNLKFYKNLNPERQKMIQSRLESFNSLPEEERQLRLQKLREWQEQHGRGNSGQNSDTSTSKRSEIISRLRAADNKREEIKNMVDDGTITTDQARKAYRTYKNRQSKD